MGRSDGAVLHLSVLILLLTTYIGLPGRGRDDWINTGTCVEQVVDEGRFNVTYADKVALAKAPR